MESCFLKKIDPENDYSPKGKFPKGVVPEKETS